MTISFIQIHYKVSSYKREWITCLYFFKNIGRTIGCRINDGLVVQRSHNLVLKCQPCQGGFFLAGSISNVKGCQLAALSVFYSAVFPPVPCASFRRPSYGKKTVHLSRLPHCLHLPIMNSLRIAVHWGLSGCNSTLVGAKSVPCCCIAGYDCK